MRLKIYLIKKQAECLWEEAFVLIDGETSSYGDQTENIGSRLLSREREVLNSMKVPNLH